MSLCPKEKSFHTAFRCFGFVADELGPRNSTDAEELYLHKHPSYHVPNSIKHTVFPMCHSLRHAKIKEQPDVFLTSHQLDASCGTLSLRVFWYSLVIPEATDQPHPDGISGRASCGSSWVKAAPCEHCTSSALGERESREKG